MTQVAAKLIVAYKFSVDTDWEEKEEYRLDLPTIRIGRLPKSNEIVLKSRFASRRHCSMFKQTDLIDYEIMDGTREEISIASPDTNIISSYLGTVVNGHKLEPGEKRLLRDRDEIIIVPNQVKLIYLRPQNKMADREEDSTFIMSELI